MGDTAKEHINYCTRIGYMLRFLCRIVAFWDLGPLSYQLSRSRGFGIQSYKALSRLGRLGSQFCRLTFALCQTTKRAGRGGEEERRPQRTLPHIRCLLEQMQSCLRLRAQAGASCCKSCYDVPLRWILPLHAPSGFGDRRAACLQGLLVPGLNVEGYQRLVAKLFRTPTVRLRVQD